MATSWVIGRFCGRIDLSPKFWPEFRIQLEATIRSDAHPYNNETCLGRSSNRVGDGGFANYVASRHRAPIVILFHAPTIFHR